MKKKVIIIGGGAAGFFAAINMAESSPDLEITLLEKSSRVLEKVKVSGGGRCNITHACFDPKDLVKFYPRGEKELLGPFHQFMTGDTMEWFEKRGVPLKIETDNRVFPVSNSSQSVIDCLLNSANSLGVKLLLNQKVKDITIDSGVFTVFCEDRKFRADSLLITTGSNPQIWKILENLGHHIITPVPSLFTFKISDVRLKDLAGLSVAKATVSIPDTNFSVTGPVLVTHWGLSGPAILKLSALAALYFAEKNYQTSILVNWNNDPEDAILSQLKNYKNSQPRKLVANKIGFEQIPNRLWLRFTEVLNISPQLRWGEVSNDKLAQLAEQITKGVFLIDGKTTFKEEFVTAGGIDLKEIDFKRFESKIHNNLYFAGETLNIDAVTGGFNFQNAWTGAFIAAKAIASV
ncbi:MAG: NAD(P)/FAD-dependent oxidoreductase [Flavobacteriaceae bacterium]|nr:NAD(P)/FAD-dependent oxidoreductase [Flavobacteriaceae bacterium]